MHFGIPKKWGPGPREDPGRPRSLGRGIKHYSFPIFQYLTCIRIGVAHIFTQL